ncbi:MAG: N-acetylmuramoyl-L-alanine amidase [Kiritimatiellae bacterium]|nr:N-acetylmuramoyl-L-alanine amidase [Kiritimatiellia bacterium]
MSPVLLSSAAGLCAVAFLFFGEKVPYGISSCWSPRNGERPRRQTTQFIILHTTEAAEAGSLKKIRANGEAHYFVGRDGHVYRIIHRDRVAFHAGRSMWNGTTCLDACSIGIEVAGYYNQEPTTRQYEALRALLREIRRIYPVPDDRVLTHCMVAYGAPNRWHPYSHRGRKRCGMIFALPAVRAKLGLGPAPPEDPDVKRGRLVVGDPYLAQVLYSASHWPGMTIASTTSGSSQVAQVATEAPPVEDYVIRAGRTAWDVARDAYRSPTTVYVFPDGRQVPGDRIRDWKAIPTGTRVILGEQPVEDDKDGVSELGADGHTVLEIAGREYANSTTLYLLPNGQVRRGSEMAENEFRTLPAGTRVLLGYAFGGQVTARRTAFQICGARWKFPSTFYRFPDGTLLNGSQIKEGKIPPGTVVLYRL